MRYTPVELRHIRIGRAFRGYKRREIDNLLEDVASSFEQVWGERGELSDKVEELEKALAEYKERESLLASTLVSAEKAAAEAKDGARREAELIISEAHHEARSITRTALGERERLFAEARRVELLLRSALGIVEETRPEHTDAGQQPQSEALPAAPAAQESVDAWPNREDTREFEAVELLGEPEEAAPAPASDPHDEVQAPAPVESTAEAAAAKLPPPLPAVEDDDGPWAGRDIAWG
jgi:cell division initiation protein